MKLDGGPWFVGLDELLRHYSHGAHGLPCALSEPCQGEPLPAEWLASGPDTPLHIATRNNDIATVREASQIRSGPSNRQTVRGKIRRDFFCNFRGF